MMQKYFKYLNYLIRHKYYVMLKCFQRKLYFQGIFHDLSKFFPDEFLSYTEFFYGKDSKQKSRESRYQNINDAPRYFQRAWQKHLMRNKHHWQNWINIQDEGTMAVLEMPKKFAEEMVCDWIGAGRAQGYYNKNIPKEEVKKWYIKNNNKLILHPNTRIIIENIINQ